MARLALTVIVSLLVVACGGGSSPTRVPASQTAATAAPATVAAQPTTANASPGAGGLPTGDQLCSLLTAADFSALNLQADAHPTVNSDGPGSANCTYRAGTSGAQGGLELDAFVDATESDAQATFDTAAGEAGATLDIALPGANDAAIDPADKPGVLAVRIGNFTFVISVPPSDASQVQLTTLAALVIGRAATML